MSEEDKHKLSKILYYSDTHPADTEFINNIIYDLQQENNQLKKDINRILENSYTEEQLDFAVNEVKEQVKAEQQLTDMLYNNIDKLRVKNYELCEENKQLKDKIKDTIKDLQENNNGDDYSLINVINILKSLLEE